MSDQIAQRVRRRDTMADDDDDDPFDALMGIDAMGDGDAPLHVEKTGKQADFLGSPFVV